MVRYESKQENTHGEFEAGKTISMIHQVPVCCPEHRIACSLGPSNISIEKSLHFDCLPAHSAAAVSLRAVHRASRLGRHAYSGL